MKYFNRNENWVTESHRRYIDLQLVINGNEYIKIFDLDESLIISNYSKTDDLILYDTSKIIKKDHFQLELRNGFFSVFFPQDVHMTQIMTPNNNQVLKFVIKIDYNYFLRNL